MNFNPIYGAVAVLGIAVAPSAQAQLFDRGGGLIYDSTLNVTWLADANYAKTSGYDDDGRMTWGEANTWADGLVIHDAVRNLTYSDWRLPTLNDLGAAGCNYSYSASDCGYNVDTASSELASLYYGALGNKALVNASGQQQLDYGLVDDPANPNDETLFSNLQSDYYWFGTTYANSPNSAWSFRLSTGEQYYHPAAASLMRAWAVRNGDVGAPQPVPLPGAAWLFGSTLLGVVYPGRAKAGKVCQV